MSALLEAINKGKYIVLKPDYDSESKKITSISDLRQATSEDVGKFTPIKVNTEDSVSANVVATRLDEDIKSVAPVAAEQVAKTQNLSKNVTDTAVTDAMKSVVAAADTAAVKKSIDDAIRKVDKITTKEQLFNFAQEIIKLEDNKTKQEYIDKLSDKISNNHPEVRQSYNNSMINVSKLNELQQNIKYQGLKSTFSSAFGGGRKTKRVRRSKSKRRSTNKARPRSRKAGSRKAKR